MSDWQRMAADLAEMRAQNPTPITIRRGGVTLPAQTVRLARLGNAAAQVADAGALGASLAQVLVSGPPALDVQPGDRFTVAGNLYEVLLVRPNRRAGTQAEAKLLQ